MAFIAIDGGGTNLRVALYHDKGGKELARKNVPTHPEDYGSSLDSLHGTILQLADLKSIRGIGVSIAGNTDGKTILGCGNLPGWIGKPLADDLNQYACPIWLFNDGQATGASEYAVHKNPLVFVIWGTGVGLSIVLGEDIFDPASSGPSLIGEGGHQRIIAHGGRRCGCGQEGCLEAYMGGAALARHYGKPAEQLSEEEWDETLGYVALGLHNVTTITGGKLPIVMGGGIACRQAIRLARLACKLQPTRKIIPELPTIMRATYGDDAGLHGTAVIVARQLAA